MLEWLVGPTSAIECFCSGHEKVSQILRYLELSKYKQEVQSNLDYPDSSEPR